MKKLKLHKGKKYNVCACGLSKILPLCDNAHREYNEKNGTNYKSVKIIAEETVNSVFIVSLLSQMMSV